MNAINDNIKKIRVAKKLTQENVAKKLGVSRVWYNRLEQNEIDIKVNLLPKLAKIFGVPVQDLTEVNGSNFFSSNNSNSQIKNIANVVNENDSIKELYERLLIVKDDLIKEKELQIKNLLSMIKNK